MRELDPAPSGLPRLVTERIAIVGHGRLGGAIAAALVRAGIDVDGPFGHGDSLASLPGQADAVLLCVPDAEIVAVAAAVPMGRPVGHCSGATALDALGAHEAFSLHPLMTVSADARPNVLEGAGAAIAGATAQATALARELAERLGMAPIEIAERDRVAYHAAASIAANFLVTLEDAAERVGETAGLPRELLVPLVRTAVENWAEQGSRRALTGPVSRGDTETVRRQRAALAQRTPELLELFDALTDATERLSKGARRAVVTA